LFIYEYSQTQQWLFSGIFINISPHAEYSIVFSSNKP